MSQLVPREDIEMIVGCPRQVTAHVARAVSYQRTVYILHSRECLDSGIDLRECAYSLALDLGIDESAWPQDEPVHVEIAGGRLCPANDPGDGEQ